MAIDFEFEIQDPRNDFYQTQTKLEQVEAAAKVDNIDQALELLYPTEQIKAMTEELLEETDFDLKANGRKWAVAILPGDDPRADIARRVETERFSKFFNHHPLEHYIDYGIYDHASIFVTVIDAQHEDGPKAASVLRIVGNSDIGLKTVNTLISSNEEENPWYPEMTDALGEFSYADLPRMRKLVNQMFNIIPENTWAIETMAVLEEYAGKKGEFGESSFPLYAACLQLSNRAQIDSWISIQDIKPLMQMQEIFSNPWSFTPLSVQNYEGEYPTIPAVIHDMPLAQQELRDADPFTAGLLIDGDGMSDAYVMPEELQGVDFLDAVANR